MTKFASPARDALRALDTPFGRLTVFEGDGAAVNRALGRYDEQAESELSFLRAMSGEGAVVVDVGAHIGAHTLALSRFVGADGQIVAIERAPESFQVLARNVEANGLANVRVSAEATSVDDLALADCALIKIDADGAEDVVLRGAQRTVQRVAPLIYAECGSLAGGLRTLAALKELGYRALAHVVAPRDGANPGEREVALVGIADAHGERIERYQLRPSESLLEIESADDLALALLRPASQVERGDVASAPAVQELRDKLERAETALAEAQRLVHERSQELSRLRGQLELTHEALTETQRLAIDRAKEIEALNRRIDGDEKVSMERQTILEAMQLRADLNVSGKEALDVSDGGPSDVATRNDVVQCYRRILRREAESEKDVEAHLKGAPSLRDLVRKLVHSVEADTAATAGPLAWRSVDQREYLAANFTNETRYACFVHHYDYLSETVSNAALKMLLRNGVTVYESCPAAVSYSVRLVSPFRGAYEGELSLQFLADDQSMFVTAFSIVPGPVVGLEDERVILVTRMQGQSRSPTAIRLAAKENSDVAPQAILFAALQGIARAIGVERIAGVQATNLVAYEADKAAILEKAYDEFYASVGASGPHNGFYVWSASTPEKPLSQVKPGHRLRTKAKRAFKAMVAKRVSLAWPVLVDPDYEFLDLGARNIQVAVLRDRASALRVELARFAGLTSASLYDSINRVLARLVSRRTRTLKWSRFAMSRSAFERRLVKSGLFDESWYLTQYKDVASSGLDPLEHFFSYGAAEGRDPNAFFSTKEYLAENPDAAKSGLNALVHYCLYGAARKAPSAHRLRPVESTLTAPAPPPASGEREVAPS